MERLLSLMPQSSQLPQSIHFIVSWWEQAIAASGRLIPFSNEARHWDIFISEFQVSTHCHFRCYSKSYHLLEYIWYHIYLQHSNFSLNLRECGKKLRLLILDM